jgi:hypothetical protein
MRSTYSSAQATNQATAGVARYFTQDSRTVANRPARYGSYPGHYTMENTQMNFAQKGTRATYARVLYAAAVAALLSACSPSADEPAAKANTTTSTTTIRLSETTSSSDMPEVVVTASRVQPENIG